MSYGDTPMCQIWLSKVNRNKVMSRTRRDIKPYKFDLKVKVQGRIWIMNVRDTSSRGDICQIWLADVKPKRSYGPDTNLHRQTDRQSDSYIPPELCSRGV